MAGYIGISIRGRIEIPVPAAVACLHLELACRWLMDDLISRAAAAGPWFHSIELPGGVITPGDATLEAERARADVYFSAGVAGLSVLDVGAWDGFYSFEAEVRGASRVLAVDRFCWDGGGWGSKRAFDFARMARQSRVESRVLDLDETTVQNVGEFDVVLFAGIIYHVPEPIGVLRQLAAICRRRLIVETLVDELANPRPVMVFYPGEERPPAFGWGPNPLLMHAMLRHLGFGEVGEIATPDSPHNRRIFIASK
jgi:tRNA (mo5U34)-methyltransferase